ncbi:MAG: antibiotic resistance protein MarC [Saprospiraceae bacterium]|nr:antibiotic resistance protein MarC [Candidatus Brachybacter algidus]
MAVGLVILNSGFNLLNGKVIRAESINDKMKEEAKQKEDISFSPLAMPLLSGPGSISLLISLFSQHNSWDKRGIILGVLFTLGVIVYLLLLSAPLIAKLLGEAGMKAITRIMGFIVMAIACQYIVSGAMSLIAKY